MIGHRLTLNVTLTLLTASASLSMLGQNITKTAAGAQPLTAETSSEVIRAMYSQFNVPHDADVSLGTPLVSDFTGYDRLPITVTVGKQIHKVDLLLSRDRKSLLRYTTVDLTNDDPTRELDISHTLGWGTPDAPVHIIAFMDLQCPFCAEMHRQFTGPTLKQYGDKVWITYKPFPLESHDYAMSFAKHAECIGQQSVDAYKSYVNALYAPNPQDTSKETGDVEALAARIALNSHLDSARISKCLSDPKTLDIIQHSMDAGEKAGVSATPTFFVNGEKVRGGLTQAALWKVIDRAEDNYKRQHASDSASLQPTVRAAAP